MRSRRGSKHEQSEQSGQLLRPSVKFTRSRSKEIVNVVRIFLRVVAGTEVDAMTVGVCKDCAVVSDVNWVYSTRREVGGLEGDYMIQKNSSIAQADPIANSLGNGAVRCFAQPRRSPPAAKLGLRQFRYTHTARLQGPTRGSPGTKCPCSPCTISQRKEV